MDGISFVSEVRQRALVDGLRVELQRVFGREGVVAWNEGLEASGC